MIFIKIKKGRFLQNLKTVNKEIGEMAQIINDLWPLIQLYLRKGLGADEILNLKQVAKESNRLIFLKSLSESIEKAKVSEGCDILISFDIQEKYNKIKEKLINFKEVKNDLVSQIKELEQNELHLINSINQLKVKWSELEAFKAAATSFIVNQFIDQEEILFLLRSNEKSNTFQPNNWGKGMLIYENNIYSTNKVNSGVFDDYQPAPSFMKALINEEFYYRNLDDSWLIENWSDSKSEEGDVRNKYKIVISTQENTKFWSKAIKNMNNRHDKAHGKTSISNSSLSTIHKNKSRNDLVDDSLENRFKKYLQDNLFEQIKNNCISQISFNKSCSESSSFGLIKPVKSQIDSKIYLNIHNRQLQSSNACPKLKFSRVSAYNQ